MFSCVLMLQETLSMERLILIILVTVPGVLSGNWGVTYEDQCALKGATVVIECKYDYPWGHFVTAVSWSKAQDVAGEQKKILLAKLASPPNHFRYAGNYRGDCRLTVNEAQHADEGEYFFSFVTTLDRWSSPTPARLSVRELTSAVQPSTVTEGGNVSLTCVSGCLAPINIVWFRDGQTVTNPVFQAEREHAGRYYCAVLGQETARSAPVDLNVQYAPSNITLSMSPSAVKGGWVTLTCSSDANPPVTQSGYSLYKDGHFISSGQNHTISDLQPTHSGPYYCQAWNNISRRGIDPSNSTEVHLDVQYRPENISISMDPPHVAEGSGVNLTCSSAANPAADNYTWYSSAGSSSSSLLQVGSGPVLSLPSVEASHTGLYLCRARNPLGENNSTEVLLTVEIKGRGRQSLKVLIGVGVGIGGSVFVTSLLWLWLKQRSHAKRKAPASHEDEVSYSTVTIKPRKPPRHGDDSCSKAGENTSVIYTSLAESS